MKHRGQFVIARILGTVDDPYYKYTALLETGDLQYNECYVAYRGDSDKLKGDVVVRLEYPFEKISDLNLNGKIASNFITSTMPDGFEFASSDEVILYGIWEERMVDGPGAPIIGKIINYYDVGIIQSILHYGYGKDQVKIAPYRLHRSESEIMGYEDTGKIHSVKSALYEYLRRMNELPEKHLLPRMVTIAEKNGGQGLETILNAFDETSLIRLQMEPQQQVI
jgi:hypothetical protein|tara:strand:+ start:39678 stop:40346 length:669 start_codon:yes stop_codon:yes gene_type:complete